jgi:hypothetical protein
MGIGIPPIWHLYPTLVSLPLPPVFSVLWELEEARAPMWALSRVLHGSPLCHGQKLIWGSYMLARRMGNVVQLSVKEQKEGVEGSSCVVSVLILGHATSK